MEPFTDRWGQIRGSWASAQWRSCMCAGGWGTAEVRGNGHRASSELRCGVWRWCGLGLCLPPSFILGGQVGIP